MKNTVFVLVSILCVAVWVSEETLQTVESAKALQVSEPFENFDIRESDSEKRTNSSSQAAIDGLKARVPGIKVESHRVFSVPEIISPGPENAATYLSPPSDSARAEILLAFLHREKAVFGLSRDQIDQLVKTSDYANPNGDLSFVHFEQTINGVPVFQGEIKAGFTRRNEIIRVVNNLAPNLDYDSISTDFGEPETAVRSAAKHVGINAADAETRRISDTSNNLKASFERGQFDDVTTAEKVYFPLKDGAAKPAWRVLVWLPTSAFYVIVDAEDGTLLWRKNITAHQTQSATFGVYGSNSGLMLTADSPTPATPFTCAAPVGCPQLPMIDRTLFTLIGNEEPNTFNNLGWIPDTGLPVRTPANPNITDGNNAEVGIDRDGVNGVDPLGHAAGNPTRVFNFAYNPAPGNPPPPDDPTPPNPQTYPPTPFQQGITTHGFYTVNRWHDATYRLGFTEQAGNFQHFNFGRGGSEGDRVSFEVQDGSGSNGANFATPADGGRGRMQMFLWTGPTPDRDGTLDTTVVLHEITHGLSNRLHGNATGLGTNMARGMGEGWSDFYAVALLSEPTDTLSGVYAVGGYITHQITPGFEANHYYGIRRFPLAIKAFVGPNGLPHNPLTFGYLNANCAARIGTTTTNPNSAYPRGPIGVSQCDQIHNMGEVWSTILWEVRGQLIARHGADEGNRRALQYVMDGMKLSPLNPTMIQARDSILLTIQATDASDLRWAWRGFAIRGMGLSAAVVSQSPANVIEAFDIPVQFRRPVRADYDGDRKTDISVFRPSDRIWYINRSTAGFTAANFGLSTDIPISADYDGDGKTDIAVYRGTDDPSLIDFYILRSSDLTVTFGYWGLATDIPVVEDYDGDRKADLAIFRTATNTYWILRSSDGVVDTDYRGPNPVKPVTGDFDGNGVADIGAFQNGTWVILLERGGSSFRGMIVNLGTGSDKLVPADYDGDGIDDVAVYRPSTGAWMIRKSTGGIVSQQFGISTDRPAPGDYDGDGRADIAIYRDGQWWINGSTSGIQVANFGLHEDIPTPASNNQ